MGAEFHQSVGGDDIRAVLHGLFRRCERLVLHELKSPAVVDECIVSDARRVVVGFRKASVDDHQLAVGLHGILSAPYHHLRRGR